MTGFSLNYNESNSNDYDPKTTETYYTSLLNNINNITKQQDDNTTVTRWNTYYYKKYKAQNKMLMIIIGICFIIIILSMLHKNFPYFDPDANEYKSITNCHWIECTFSKSFYF